MPVRYSAIRHSDVLRAGAWTVEAWQAQGVWCHWWRPAFSCGMRMTFVLTTRSARRSVVGKEGGRPIGAPRAGWPTRCGISVTAARQLRGSTQSLVREMPISHIMST